MHRMVTALLLGMTVAMPALAQDRDDVRAGWSQPRGDGDRTDDRDRDDPRADDRRGPDDDAYRGPDGDDGRWAGRRAGHWEPAPDDRREDRDARFDPRRAPDRGDEDGRFANNRGDGRWNPDGYRDGDGRGERAMRLPRYHDPRGAGAGYRRWSPGYRIAPAYYDRSYRIARPDLYRLPPVRGDYRWVRYHDDAVLVDIRSGVVRDMMYGYFR